jgi:hypothetical protein
MPKMIQLRRVPDDVYTVVKTQAEQQGLSISDFLVRELTLRFGTPGSGAPDGEPEPHHP